MDSITDSMDMSLSKLREMVKGREAWHAAVHRVAKSQTRMSDGITINLRILHLKLLGTPLSHTAMFHQGQE